MAKFVDFKNRAGTGDVRVKGLSALMQRINRLEEQTDNALQREILRTVGRIARRANRDVPIDTGLLSRSIRIGKTGINGAFVKADTHYAGFVDKGTSRMRAQPYFEKHIGPEIEQMKRNIKRWLEAK